nr:integrin linked protein kinase [Hymenolepis microstoma]
MNFGDLRSPGGVKALDEFLLTRSYIEGYQASKADACIFESIPKAPDATYVNALRWYNHIKSFGDRGIKFPGNCSPATKDMGDEEADDDFDLFGSEDEAEAEKRRAAALASYNTKNTAKTKPVAKSMIILDVKPWDDETDMDALEKCVRSIEVDGLLWGSSKLVPIFQGIKKLQITCVVEDDKVGTDLLEEEILKFSDHVQSVDIAAFNKL